MLSFRTIAGIGLLTARLGLNALLRTPRRVTLPERLGNLPTHDLPLRAPVRIRWNEHQVPFIEAGHDRDLAVALGMVHAHLRLAQLETMRRLATGRIAEVLGPAAVEVDATVRTLHLTRAVPEMLTRLPEPTRDWLQGFADGLNVMIDRAPVLPHEFAVHRLRPERWTVADLLALGRLAAADFTWRVWVRLLRLRGRPDWLRLWQRLMADEGVPVPSFAGGAGASVDMVETWLGAFGRPGSNSLAVAARRSATGGALLASDPHLSFVLPNLWLIAGYRSPSYHLVGMMIPGVPVMAFGRNPWIGWGGTSLHAASSELFDVTDLPESAIIPRRETIKVRWWADREIVCRDTEYGPVVSETPLLRAPDRRLALHWVGHTPTDEITAMLAVNRARNWDEFSRAIDGFAIPAQNMIYADTRGRVGQAMAAKLPRRPGRPPPDLFVAPEARRHWESFVTAKDLPSLLDPERGFVASANNRPAAATAAPVGFFFSPDDRVRRIAALLGGHEAITPERLAALHRDVTLPSALELRDALLALAKPDTAAGAQRGRLFAALRAWNGSYEIESAGALAFELLVYHFAHALHGDEDLAIYSASWDPWALLRADLRTVAPQALAAALERATERAAEGLARLGAWGDAHRLRLGHAFGTVPGIGRRYRYVDVPVGGSNESLMKTAHGFSGDRHAARFGANARHISDFADPDANFFVLLGGQDGWLGSTTFLDQFPLWRRSQYIQVPLSPETVRERFPHETVLTP